MVQINALTGDYESVINGKSLVSEQDGLIQATRRIIFGYPGFMRLFMLLQLVRGGCGLSQCSFLEFGIFALPCTFSKQELSGDPGENRTHI